VWSAADALDKSVILERRLSGPCKSLKGRKGTDTWTSFTSTSALGVLGARRSEHAIRAATTKATVVKKPKTF